MKIVTDCAADLSPEERDELGIVEAPLYIQFPEEEVNAADITPDEFRYIGGFDLLRGYSEQIFPSYRYLIGTIEQRFITGKYSRLYLFGDFGIISKSPIDGNYDFYPGYGFGAQFPTIPGTFRFELAWGKTGFPENLILNFGFLRQF